MMIKHTFNTQIMTFSLQRLFTILLRQHWPVVIFRVVHVLSLQCIFASTLRPKPTQKTTWPNKAWHAIEKLFIKMFFSHSGVFNSWRDCLVTDGIYRSQEQNEKCYTKSVLKWCKQKVLQKMQLLQLCKAFFCVFESCLHCDHYNDFHNTECHTFECCTSGCQMSACHDGSMSYMGSYMSNNCEELVRLCSQPSGWFR